MINFLILSFEFPKVLKKMKYKPSGKADVSIKNLSLELYIIL